MAEGPSAIVRLSSRRLTSGHLSAGHCVLLYPGNRFSQSKTESQGGAVSAQAGSLFRDAIQTGMAAQEQIPAGDGGGGVELFIQLVAGELFELVGLFDDHRGAVASDQVDPAVGSDGRRVDALQTLDPFGVDQGLARGRVEAGQ